MILYTIEKSLISKWFGIPPLPRLPKFTPAKVSLSEYILFIELEGTSIAVFHPVPDAFKPADAE